MKTNEKLDKDRFRQDLGGESEAYQEVARRLGLLPEDEEIAVLDLDSHRKKRGKLSRQLGLTRMLRTDERRSSQGDGCASPRPRRHPERRARPARLSRARRHGGRARLGRRCAARPAAAARRRLGSGPAARPRKSATTAFGRSPAVLDVPPIAAPLRRLCEWTADYYLSPLASVLRMVLPSSAALDGPRQLTEYRPTGLVPDRLTPQREKALAALEGRQGTVRELAAPCRGQRRA